MTEAESDQILRPEFWNVEAMKSSLLKGVNGNLYTESSFPKTILLNPQWIGFLEDLYYEMREETTSRATFFYEHPEENARILKTNAEHTKVLIQTKNQKGSNTHVSVDITKVKYPELLLGCLHKHPQEALFTSEDILPMTISGGELIVGIVTPAKYYLAFRTKETPNLNPDVNFRRGYFLAMAKSHKVPIYRLRPSEIESFTMTPQILKELRLPLFEGKRNQRRLELINS